MAIITCLKKSNRDLKNTRKKYREAKENYSKEKAVEYYAKNKEAIKEKLIEHYKNLSPEEKDKINEYQRKMCQELVQYKKEALKNKQFFCSLPSIKHD